MSFCNGVKSLPGLSSLKCSHSNPGLSTHKYNVMVFMATYQAHFGLYQFDTVEMTAKQRPEVRKELWAKKRVFFCTPQIVENDIAKGEVIPREQKRQ